MKVLVVDDSKTMRMIVIRNLRQIGYGDATIIEAGNGSEALDVIASAQPDLVLSDWNMPEMNGIDLLRALRSQGNRVPFGFVTSESSPDMELQARNAGAEFLIAKPFTVEAFQAQIGLLT